MPDKTSVSYQLGKEVVTTAEAARAWLFSVWTAYYCLSYSPIVMTAHIAIVDALCRNCGRVGEG